jgi:hypothetical protein
MYLLGAVLVLPPDGAAAWSSEDAPWVPLLGIVPVLSPDGVPARSPEGPLSVHLLHTMLALSAAANGATR